MKLATLPNFVPLCELMETSIQKYLNQYFPRKSTIEYRSLGGGCINDCFQVKTETGNFFLKINSARAFPNLFQKEKQGLDLLAVQKIIRVPEPMMCEQVGEKQIFLLEWIDTGSRTEYFWKSFGEQLARLHQVTRDYFGLDDNNYMGSLHQDNQPHTDWNSFFIHCRLEPQIRLARQKGLLPAKNGGQFEKLYVKVSAIFNPEKPSLLHGDLWSGNFICDKNSQPVLIDPAVYFGHRAVDLAMTTLFGGFDKAFYDAYQYHCPFPGNYREQWDVANLYPLLIHLNIFGSSYLAQIEQTLNRFA